MIGFEAKSVNSDAVFTAVDKIFSPEFRNRLDGVVNFNGLTHEVVLMIVKKAIGEFAVQLREKNVNLQVTDLCYEWLAGKGYSEEFGAREIARLIQDKVKRFFVDEVLFGKLQKGGIALVDMECDDVVVRVLEECEVA
jgi:ATP-dependent Clp protease ATP-binding subunit ClpA